MTFREIKKLLEADGWRLVRVCGSHNQFRKAGNPYAVTVPNHGSRSISIGVIKDLEKKTGLSLSEVGLFLFSVFFFKTS